MVGASQSILPKELPRDWFVAATLGALGASMLQINTGKLFSRGVGRTNALSGVLYTNARLGWNSRLETLAGALKNVGADHQDTACLFEIEERIEAPVNEPGVLVSHGVGPFLDDFAIVATFGLGAIFSRRAETVRALTGSEGRRGGRDSHHTLLSGVYDETVDVSDVQAEEFARFVEALLALERRSFLGAMRAMRSFVSGLHRLADDPSLAYTLLVAAIESLAQTFDDYEPRWQDLDMRKRVDLDRAIASAATDVQEAFRAAVLKHEHLSLGRRYREFILARVDGGYFRQTGLKGRPVARWELEPALRLAYGLRSAHVHELKRLPDVLTIGAHHNEIASVERQPALTFEGLYRVTRHAIRAFVAEQPKIESEPYNYQLEEAGIVSLPWAEQYWIGRPFSRPSEALPRFEGALEILCSQLMHEPNPALFPDMRPVLAEVERLLGQAPHADRPAMVCLYILYNTQIAPAYRSPGHEAFIEAHIEEASRPGPVTLTLVPLYGEHDDDAWSLPDHQNALDAYFDQRRRANGLHAPRLVEAAMCLHLAEKYRLVGDLDSARTTIARAVETHPGVPALLALEARFNGEAPIDWEAVLLPPAKVSEVEGGMA